MNIQPGHIPSIKDRSNSSRILDIDALRAFALFGILVANMELFASIYTFFGVENPIFTSSIDHAVTWLGTLLINTKFYLLFSFLFGYSFTLQMESATKRGVRLAPQIIRRMIGLFILGSIHAIFFYHGDILRLYAVLGLVLLMLHTIRPRTAFILASVFIGITAAFMALSGLFMPAEPTVSTDTIAAFSEAASTTAAFQEGPISVVTENIKLLPRNLMVWVFMMATSALGAFLTGLAFGKKQLFVNISQHTVILRIIQYIGYPVGLIGAFIYATYGMSLENASGSLLSLALNTITAPFLTAAYIASLLHFFHSGRAGKWIASTLAPMGRMALTNYLLQSIICTFIFTGFGFGLMGHVSPLMVWIISIVIFLIQVLISKWWMDRHRYGPGEWILRVFTYLQWPAWRKGGSKQF